MTSRPRPGRPRHTPGVDATGSPRDQILDAAAGLFVEHGFSATSTRMIAEQVGIRQASLYYHFAGKDEILIDLLTTSVRPSLDVVRSIEALVPDSASAAAALYSLAVVDVHTLVQTPHNIGRLYLLPEVQHERYDSFRAERRELQEAYGRLGAGAATPAVLAHLRPEQLGELLIQLVEVVIHLRDVREPDSADAEGIASSCLRVCGLDDAAIDRSRSQSAQVPHHALG